MISAILTVASAATEGLAVAAQEGLAKLGVQDLGGTKLVGGDGKLFVGGDVKSVLSAMEVNPEALGEGVRNAGRAAAELRERIPLEDSKGVVRHELSPQEAAHYENVGLSAQEVNGRECLVRSDIDWEQRDAYDQTNKARSEQGLAPLDTAGRPYELHHVQQKSDGMLAELTRDEHRGVGIDRILHDPTKASEINRVEFDQDRGEHWRARAREV